MSAAKAAFEAVQRLFGSAIKGLKELKWEDVPAPVRRFIEENPRLTAVQVAMVLVLTCPGLVVTPLLGWMGFTSIGPVAGTFAAWYQSTFGATWVFSGFQSAAMAGYAAPAVNGVVQGAAFVGGGVAQWFKR